MYMARINAKRKPFSAVGILLHIFYMEGGELDVIVKAGLRVLLVKVDGAQFERVELAIELILLHSCFNGGNKMGSKSFAYFVGQL